MGGKTTSTTATKLNQISVQSSALGLPLAIGWGRGRITRPNLIWYGGFRAISHTTKTSGGKGLGGGSSNTTYTYTASIMLALCEGGATGIRDVVTVYRDSSVLTGIGDAGLSLAVGTPDQAVWGYLTSLYPTQALAYSGIAYVYAQDYGLSDSATLPNHSFEVDFAIQLGGSVVDADPRDIVTDFLTSAQYGVPSWSAGLIADWSDWSLYCRAAGLLLSPVLESQATASSTLAEWLLATNSYAVWSEGVLKIGSYGDTAVTGNGVTWTPDLSPEYDLTEDDMIADGDGCPVQQTINDQSDAYNSVQLEYLDRANAYNTAIASAQDLANIVEFGLRKQDPTTVHSICDATVAQQSAQLYLQRTLYVREGYTNKLPWNFVLLEPGDLVTLTTTTDELQLSRELVRITEIEEDEDGILSFTYEGLDIGTASAALYSSHSADGYQANTNVDPGSVVTTAIFEAPSDLTGFDPEVWVAVASLSSTWGGCNVWISGDGTSYRQIGTINEAARYGVTTVDLPLHADPDNDDTLSVDLSESLGIITGGTEAEMNAGATLALVGGELVSYRDAALTAAHHYSLSPLRRGLHGTTPADAPAGSTFIRLDEAVFKFGFKDLNVGQTMYLKFPSFNLWGNATQDLSEVSAFEVPVSAAASRYSWEDLPDTDGTKPANNATVGATIGVNLKLPSGALAVPADVLNTDIALGPDGRLTSLDFTGATTDLGKVTADGIGAATTVALAAATQASHDALQQLNTALTATLTQNAGVADDAVSAAHRVVEDAVDRLEQLQLTTTLAAGTTRETLSDAGIYVDPTTGLVRIYGVDQTATAITEAQIRLSAAEGKICLQVTRVDLNAAILAAQLGGGNADIGPLLSSIANVQVNLDAVNAQVGLKADLTTLGTLAGRVTTVAATVDALTGEVALKADSATVEGLDARLVNAEVAITALGDVSSYSATVSAVRLLDGEVGDAAENALRAVLAGDAGAFNQVQQLSYAHQQLTAQMIGLDAAQATQRLLLLAQVQNAEASIALEQVARVDAVSALTGSLATYQAQFLDALALVQDKIAAVAQDGQSTTTAVRVLGGAVDANGEAALRNLVDQGQSALDSVGQIAAFREETTSRLVAGELSVIALSQTFTTKLAGNSTAVQLQIIAITDTQQSAADQLVAFKTEFDGNTSTVNSQLEALTTGAESLSGRFDTFGAEFDGNKASVQSQLAAQADTTHTLAGQITDYGAAFDTNKASVDSRLLAQTSATGAISGRVEIAETEIADHTATLKTYGESIDGLGTKWGAEIDQDGEAVGGFVLNSTGQRVDAAFLVDTLKVVKRGGDGSKKTIFDIGDDGIVYILAKLLANSIETGMLNGHAVTIREEEETTADIVGSGDTLQPVVTLSFDLPHDADVLISISGSHGYFGGVPDFGVDILLDDGRTISGPSGGAGVYAPGFAMTRKIAMTAGQGRSASLRWRGGSSSIHLYGGAAIVVDAAMA